MSEIEPSAINKELTDQIPFVIRGHHLIGFSNLSYASPEVVAKFERVLTKQSWMVAKNNPNDAYAQREGEYAQDLLGLSAEHADEFEDRTRRIFETFLTLSDDHPAEIVEAVPDTICSACIIGEHCKRLNNDINGKPINILGEDRRNSEKFIKILDDLNLPKPAIIQEQAYFSDAEPQQVRRIKTTIGTIRQVLEQTSRTVWS